MKYIRTVLPRGFGFILPLFLLTLLFFNIPIIYMLANSFSNPFPTFNHYHDLLEKSVYLKVLWNTVKISLTVTPIAMILGYPLAYWITKLSKKGQMIALAIVTMSFLVSTLVRTYAWIVILGNNGIVNKILLYMNIISEPLEMIYNKFGVTLGTLNIMLPLIVIPLYAAMLKVDDRLLKAASSLGAGPITVFMKVYFPLTLPSLASSGILIFIMTLGFFITPAILGGGNVSMISNVLDELINGTANWELASVLSVVLLIVTFAFYGLYRKVGAMK